MATLEHLREIIGGDAEALRELESLTDANGGDLTPEVVLKSARAASSPLHKHFEWDDSAAAENWRKQQARALIQSYKLHIVDGNGERTVRYFTNVIVQDEHSYRRTEEVIKVDALREQRRLRIIRDLNRIRGELDAFEAFSQAVAPLDAAIAALQPEAVSA